MKKTMTNNGKRWQQGATGFLCALLLAATLVGCKDNDPIPKDLKTEVQTLDVEKGGTASFLITEGNDKYTVTSDHPEVVTASVKDNTVSVTGISQGTNLIESRVKIGMYTSWYRKMIIIFGAWERVKR